MLGVAEYLLGALLLAVSLGAAGYVGVRAARFLLPAAAPLTFWLGAATAGLTALICFHLLPGVLGLLSAPAAAVAAIVGAVLAGRLIPSGPSVPGLRPPRPGSGVEWVGIAAITAVFSLVAANSVFLAPAAITSVDATTFHLPIVVSWIQSGSVWEIWQFVPDQWHGYYPMTGNVYQLVGILPWGSEFAVRLLGVPLLGLALAALYGSCRELGAGRASSYLVSAAALSYPAVTLYVAERPTPDIFMYASLSLGLLFLIRHLRLDGSGNLLLAGLALALSLGSRWYAVPAVVLVVGAWLWVRTREVGPGAVLRSSMPLAIPLLTLGSFWLLRNLVASGNPLMPVSFAPFGVEILAAPEDPLREAVGASIASYFDDPGIVVDPILGALASNLGVGLILLLIGGLVPMIAGASGRGRGVLPAAAAPLALAAVAIFCAYLFTPFSALGPPDAIQVDVNSRYAVPAILIATPPAALILDRCPARLQAILATFLAMGLAASLLGGPEAPLSRIVPAVIAIAAVGWTWSTGRPRGVVARAVLGSVAAALAVIGGLVLSDRFLEGRYREPPTVAEALDLAAAGDYRIAIAGNWFATTPPILAMQGPRLSNEVEFVGSFEDDALRAASTAGEFGQQLELGDYDLLLVGKADLPAEPDLSEELWAREAGWKLVLEDSRFSLYAAPVDSGE